MALLHLDFESQYMGANQDVNIIVPDKPRECTPEQFYGNGSKYRVLWLLHGTFGGYSDWIRKSNIETYACEHDLIVVMPGIGNADYEEWNTFGLGLDSDGYIARELMPLVHHWLPASSERKDNYIAGLSMGGAGALHFALKYPDKFAACASLSYAPSCLETQRTQLEELFSMNRKELLQIPDVMHSRLRSYNRMHRYDSVEEFLQSDSNLYRRLWNADFSELPALSFYCGDSDPLMWEAFCSLRKEMEEKSMPVHFYEGTGSHEWRVWERDIQRAFTEFGFTGEAKGNAF